MSERHYPEKLEVVPLQRPARASVFVPGSKSITNRALVLAALSQPGEGSRLENVSDCEDSRLMADALHALGFQVDADWEHARIHIWRKPDSHRIPQRAAYLSLGNSGTCMRFLTAMVCLGQGKYELDGVMRMRQRPMQDLLDALHQLGVRARSLLNDGYPPIEVQAGGSVFCESDWSSWTSGTVTISGNISSQFLSGLLMIAPFAQSKIGIRLSSPLVSVPFCRLTVEMMRTFGAVVETDYISFHVAPLQWYRSLEFDVEPDATSASYFLAAAAISEGRVTVLDLKDQSAQGDIRFADVLVTMGCRVEWCDSGITVHGRPMHGIDVDMNDISDCVPTLAAVACFAEGPTTIRNIAHIRHKESDRIAALATELRKVGVEVDEFSDGLRITPRPMHGAEIETYNDHRIAMSMALIGLKVPGIVIKNPGCVAKTYPGFWDDLEKLRV